MIKSYLKSFILSISIILISTIIITILNYFNIINSKLLKIVLLIIPIISILLGGYKIGKSSTKKGYIEGIKYGLIWIALFLIINLILKSMSLSSIIYMLLLLMSSILSSMVGINRKRD